MKGSLLLIALSGVLLAQTDAVPAKTTIVVRTNERIDAKSRSDRRINGVVDSDVVDKTGRVMIPPISSAGSPDRNLVLVAVIVEIPQESGCRIKKNANEHRSLPAPACARAMA